MSEFKVGDRVRIIKNGEEGVIFKIKSDLITSDNGIIEGYVDDFYDVFIDDCMVLTGLSKQELQLIEFNKYKTPEQRKIEQLEQRIEKLEKCVMGEQNSLEKCENVSNLEKKTPKLGIRDFKDMIRPNKIISDTNDPLEMIWNSTEEETKPSLLTEDERVILRNMNKDFKWIFRDIFNNLIIQKKKPKRVKHRNNEFVLEGVYVPLYCYKHLFKFIKFEDEPYNIEELLKGECGNE